MILRAKPVGFRRYFARIEGQQMLHVRDEAEREVRERDHAKSHARERLNLMRLGEKHVIKSLSTPKLSLKPF